MQKLLFALPALLALTTAAAAEPRPMNEGQLGEVAAGNLSAVSNQSTLTTTSTDISSLVSKTINSTMTGGASNTVYSTGVASNGVMATGSSTATIGGSIMAPTTMGSLP